MITGIVNANREASIHLVALGPQGGDPRKAGRFSVGHVLCGTEFSHEFNHPTEDRPAWDFGREVA
jgi:hypothetical protein